MTTPYHACYFAHELTRHQGPGGGDRLSMALFGACVDLNPHQIDAAALALRNPLTQGVLLAGEAGLDVGEPCILSYMLDMEGRGSRIDMIRGAWVVEGANPNGDV